MGAEHEAIRFSVEMEIGHGLEPHAQTGFNHLTWRVPAESPLVAAKICLDRRPVFMSIAASPIFRWLLIPYSPCPDARDSWTRPSPSSETAWRSAWRCRTPRRVESSLACPWPGEASSRFGLASSTVPTSRAGSSSWPSTRTISPAGGRGHQPLLQREAAAWVRPAGMAVSAAADPPAADQVVRRSSREQEDGCALPGARLPHATDSRRRGTGWIRLHQLVGREQGRPRAAAWSGRPPGFRVLAARRRAPHRLPAARVRCAACSRQVDGGGPPWTLPVPGCRAAGHHQQPRTAAGRSRQPGRYRRLPRGAGGLRGPLG